MIGLATTIVLALLAPASRGVAAVVAVTGVLCALLGGMTWWDERRAATAYAPPAPAGSAPVVTVMTDEAGDTYQTAVTGDQVDVHAATAIALLTFDAAEPCCCEDCEQRRIVAAFAAIVAAGYAERIAAEAAAYLALGLLPHEREAGDA